MERPDRRGLFFLTIITAVAAWLRLTGLTAQSMWSDEIGTLLTCAKPLSKTLGTIVLFDINPPLFYALAHYWQMLGHGEFILRLLPALLGVAAVPLTYALARRWAGAAAGLLAAGVLALAPAHVYYSGELRYQTLTTCLALASFIGLWDRHENRRRWLYPAATIAGLYTHYLFLFLLAAQGLWLATLPRDERRVRPRTLIVPLLAFIPGLLILALQLARKNWGVKLLAGAQSPHRLLDLLSFWTIGGPPWRPPTLPGLPDDLSWLTFLFAAPLLLLLARGIYAVRREAWGRLTILWAFFPTVVLLLLSLAAPVFETKLLLPTLPAIALLVGVGATTLRPRALAAVSLALVLVLGGSAVWQQRTDPRCARDDWRGVARQLRADLRPGDVVLNATFELRHYAATELPEERLIAGDLKAFKERGGVQSHEETFAHLDDVESRYRRVWFYPNPMRGVPIVDDTADYLRERLFAVTPAAYRDRRPQLMLYLTDRGEYAAHLAPLLPRKIDFRAGPLAEHALRGRWLPTEEGWRWATGEASAWLKHEAPNERARALIFVNVDLFPERCVTVRLAADGETITERFIDRTDQYELTGPLPPALADRPALELRVGADKIIFQDTHERLPRERARTVLVGELALEPLTP
ncbi:MAG TPA: glycosyltransferase family 39 protein [bacterium]|nr:glycosyltransferase family 39 protein [bacterium]